MPVIWAQPACRYSAMANSTLHKLAMSDSDFLAVPNDAFARHEHALRVLNLRMTSKDTETILSKPEATSKKSAYDTSKYIDFTATNKYYGKFFDPISGKDGANPPSEDTNAPTPIDEQKKLMAFEPVTLRFNPESLLKMSNEMVNAKVSSYNQNYSDKASENVNKYLSTDLYQAKRGNSLLDSFGKTYRIMHQNNDPAAPNGNGQTYTYPRIPRSSIMKSPYSGKAKVPNSGRVKDKRDAELVKGQTARLNNNKLSSNPGANASVKEEKKDNSRESKGKKSKPKVARNRRNRRTYQERVPSPTTYKRIAAELLEKQRQQKLKLAKEAAAAADSNNGAEEALVQSQIAFDNEQNYFKTDLMNSNFLPPRTFLQPTTIAREEEHQTSVKPAFVPQQTSDFAGGRRVTPSKETFDIDGFTLESFDDEMSMTRQKEAETRINLEGGTQGRLRSATNYKQGSPSFDPIPMYDYMLSDTTQNYNGITNGYNQYVSNPNNAQQNVRKLPKIIDLESLDETYEEKLKKRKTKLKKVVSQEGTVYTMKDLVPGPADPVGKGKYVQKGVFGGYVMVNGKRRWRIIKNYNRTVENEGKSSTELDYKQKYAMRLHEVGSTNAPEHQNYTDNQIHVTKGAATVPPERWKNHSLFKNAKNLANNAQEMPPQNNSEAETQHDRGAIKRHGWIKKLIQLNAESEEHNAEPKAGNDDDQVAMLTEFDNINHIDRRKINRPKKYVREFPYDVKSLKWDESKLKNKQNVYCYCGGGFVDPLKISLERMKVKCSNFPNSSENIEQLPPHLLPMLRCERCNNLFHGECVQQLQGTRLLFGDKSYKFQCSVCNDEGKEILEFRPKTWLQSVKIALYNLTLQNYDRNIKYFRNQRDICKFIDDNWDALMQNAKTATWTNTVSAVLTTHSKCFQSGLARFKDKGYWCLQEKILLEEFGFDGSSRKVDFVISTNTKIKKVNNSTRNMAKTATREYSIGTVVWAKSDNYPWWPAQVCAIDSHSCRVSFFPDQQEVRMPLRFVMPFLEHLDTLPKNIATKLDNYDLELFKKGISHALLISRVHAFGYSKPGTRLSKSFILGHVAAAQIDDELKGLPGFCADSAVSDQDSVDHSMLEVQPMKKRRGGRPPGSKNKKTKKRLKPDGELLYSTGPSVSIKAWLMDAREQGSGPFQCLVCGKIVQSTAGLKHHVTVMHKNVKFVNYGHDEDKKRNGAIPNANNTMEYPSKPFGVGFATNDFHEVPNMYMNGIGGYNAAVDAGYQNTYMAFEPDIHNIRQGAAIVQSRDSSFNEEANGKKNEGKRKRKRKRKQKASPKPIVVPEVTGEPDDTHHIKMMEISNKCPFCGKEFGRPQACGMHKKYCHKNPFKGLPTGDRWRKGLGMPAQPVKLGRPLGSKGKKKKGAQKAKKNGKNIKRGTKKFSDLVGKRVEVYWKDDDAWYPGRLVRMAPTGKFDIDYDDGYQEAGLDLGAEQFRLIDSNNIRMHLASPVDNKGANKYPVNYGSFSEDNKGRLKSLPPETYVAEKIIDTRPRNDGVQGQEYLVKWKGSTETTWEPSENIVSPQLLHNYYTSVEFQNKMAKNLKNTTSVTQSGSLL